MPKSVLNLMLLKLVLNPLTKRKKKIKIKVSIQTIVILNTKRGIKMKYGYARISNRTQNIERQIRNIKAASPEAVIIQETYTGLKTNRPAWDKLKKKLQAGDTVIFDSVSRMSRNAEEGFILYENLYHKGVELIFLKEPYINTGIYKEALQRRIDSTIATGNQATDTFTNAVIEAVNHLLMDLAHQQITAAFEQAEKEVMDLHQRTKEGIETARLNGKQIGQKKGAKLITKKSINAKEEIKKHSKSFDGSLNDIDCMKLIGLSRNTYYKYKRELIQEI